jgi:hypothetical protein
LWRVAFRRTYYTSTDQLERDLPSVLGFLQSGAPASRVPPAWTYAGLHLYRQSRELTHVVRSAEEA